MSQCVCVCVCREFGYLAVVTINSEISGVYSLSIILFGVTNALQNLVSWRVGRTQKTDTKGEAYRMFLHRDNPMQCQGFEQNGTLKISLSVHAPYSRTIRVKHQKRGVTQCRGHPEDRYQGRSLQDVLTQR